MNKYLSDIELAGEEFNVIVMWQLYSQYENKYLLLRAALHGAMLFIRYPSPLYDDIKFLFEYCRAVNHE